MGQSDELFGEDETSAVFASLTEIGAREVERSISTLTDEQCDAALTAGDACDRAEEALDALAMLPAELASDVLMRVAGELLGKLDDDRAYVVLAERGCRLSAESRGDLGGQFLGTLFGELDEAKRAVELAEASGAIARSRKRGVETALINALGSHAVRVLGAVG